VSVKVILTFVIFSLNGALRKVVPRHDAVKNILSCSYWRHNSTHSLSSTSSTMINFTPLTAFP